MPSAWNFSVGVAGFEPAASSSRTKRAAKLRHTPPPETAWTPGRPGPGTLGSLADTGNQREQGCLRPAGEPERRPRRGPEPGGHVQPRSVRAALGGMPVQATGPFGLDATVGDQGPVARYADLAAVRVAGHQQVVAVGRELVHD